MMNSLGYLGVGALMFLENIWPPIPSELIMPLAGITSAQGELQLAFVILAGTIGSVLGTLIWYFLGYFLGKERIEKFVDRHGKWLTLTRADIERADSWFDMHNTSAVFFGRLIPGVRTVISLPAGVSGMRFVPFLVWTSLGSLLWTAFLACIGYYLGENYAQITHYIGYVVPIFILLILAIYIYRFTKQHQKSKQK